MKLESGRKYLWQWELNQRLKVPEGCMQVHFANGTSADALVVDAKNGMANIPNIFLQVAASLRCYAWDGNGVIAEAMFDVLPREKPADYIYTETEVRQFDKLEADLNLRSQGRSAKYSFTTPGWKRVLNIIRGSGGMVNFCYGQSAPLYMAQVAGVVFSGFVKYGGDTSKDAKPVLYQMYNNIFGSDDAMEAPGCIAKVRIGYPDPDQPDYNNGTSSGLKNPINCYLDVYVDFDKNALNSGSVGFQMNYSGYADSHNCEAIIRETEAGDVGVYGEKLIYHELALNEGGGIYMPDLGIHAAEVSADSMNVGGNKVLDESNIDSELSASSTNPVQNKAIKAAIDTALKDAKTGKSQVQFAFTSTNISTPLLFAGMSSGESTAYRQNTDTKTPFLNGSTPVDKKEAGTYVVAGVYGDAQTGTLHAKVFDAATKFTVRGKPLVDDTEIGERTWSSKNTVDKLCPSFSESGSVVVCEPLEGYPLEVVSEFEDIDSVQQKITLTQSGKNLFDFKQPVSQVTFTGKDGTPATRWGFAVALPPGAYCFCAWRAAGSIGYVNGVINDGQGNFVNTCHLAQGNNGGSAVKVTVEQGYVVYIYNGQSTNSEKQSNTMFGNYNVQVEAGSTGTPYEPYNGATFTVDLTNAIDVEEYGAFAAGSYNWKTGVLDTESGQFQHNPEDNSFTEIVNTSTYAPPIIRDIPAMSGTNAFYSNCGDTTVKGKADPTAIIEKLTNAILALGGNV